MANSNLNYSNRSGLETFKASLFFKIIDWCLIYTMVFLCITVDSMTYRNNLHAAELPDNFGLSELNQAGRSAQTEATPFNDKFGVGYASGSANRKPVAHAGAAQTVPLHSEVQLDGSGSIDPNGDRLNYHWRLKSKPNSSTTQLQDTQVVNTRLNIDRPGNYVIELMVDDGQLDSDPTTVAISTHNSPPVARAGRDQTVLKGTRVKLDGTGSSDVDGQKLKHHWRIIQRPKGSKARLDHPNAIQPHFKADKSGDYVVRLHVEDSHHQGDDCDVHVSTHDSLPVANAGPDQTVHLNQTVNLDGSGSTDVDGSALHYHWSFTTVPDGSTAQFSDPKAVKPTFIADRFGTYVVQLSVGEGDECWKEHDDDQQRDDYECAADTVVISAEDRKPVSNAGPDQTVLLNQLVTLDGSASQDPDGTSITDYAWSLTRLPTDSHANLSDNKAPNLDFTVDQPGTYVLQLIVKSGGLTSEPDTVVIQTANSKPVANAGPDQQVKQFETVHLNGSLSKDVDNDPLAYRWSMLSKPTDSTASINPTDTVSPSFIADFPGLYVPQLIVNDGKLDSDPVTTTITATPLNHAPVIISNPVAIAKVGDAYSYAVAANDPDVGDLLSFALGNAPAGMSINASTGLITWTPSANQTGPQSVTVRVQDPGGLFAIQNYVVDVSAPTLVNRPPQINSTPVIAATAGVGYSYPVLATDPDTGDVLTYSLIQAPSGMSINTSTGIVSWTPSASQAGMQPVTIKVTDSGNLFATQDFTVTVQVAGPTCAAPPSGLVAWWPGDSTAQDYISARHGIAVNGASYATDAIGTAFTFDGVDDQIVVPDDPLWTLGSNDFSIDLWVNFNRLDNREPFIGHDDGGGNEKKWIFWYDSQGHGVGGPALRFHINGPQLGPIDPVFAPWNPQVGQWYHVAVTRLGNTYRLYIDGVEVATATDSNSIQDALAPLTIGRAEAYWFNGLVDEVDIFGRTLSAAEIKAIFDAGRNGRCKDGIVIADAGPDRNVNLNDTVILNGSASRDVAGGTITYQWVLLNKPTNSLTDFSNPNIVNPQFVADDAGDYIAQLVVNNGVRDSAPDTVHITVGSTPINHAPTITSTAPTTATVGQPYSYDVNATDPDVGNVLTYALTQSPSGMTIDSSTGVISWTPSVAQTGSVAVTVEVRDQGNLTATQPFSIAVSLLTPNIIGRLQTDAGSILATFGLVVGTITQQNSNTVPSGTVIGQTPAAGVSVAPGAAVNLVVSSGAAPASAPLSTLSVTSPIPTILVGEMVVLAAIGTNTDGTGQGMSGVVTWVSSDPSVAIVNNAGVVIGQAAGITTIRASQGTVNSSTVLTVIPRVTDTILPTAVLTSPADGTTVTGPIAITGTASDDNFVNYVLDYAPVGQTNYTTLATGTAPIVNGTLGSFDPTVLMNDIYTVRLVVSDQGGNTNEVSVNVQVARGQKVGNFSLGFQDLSILVSGIPITVTRVYDSRDKEMGDFGIGWRMDLQSLRIRSERLQGRGWYVDHPPGFLQAYTLNATRSHKISLHLPDGKVEEFDLALDPNRSLISFDVVTPSYSARAGTLGSLRSLDSNGILINDSQPGPVTLLNDETLEVFDRPQTLEYTSPDGRVLTFQNEKLISLRDLNGNQLTFGSAGITHSTGKAISFTRDAQGGITAITDANGNVLRYSYDSQGNLSSFTDALGNVTQYRYTYGHGLLEIIDARGITPIRNEYDERGRLIKSIDPAGNAINYTHDLNTQQEIVKDRLGNVTVHVYDNDGNVISTTDPLGGVTSRTYDGRGNTLTETDPLGRTRTYSYDGQDNHLTETDALGNTTRNTYNNRNQMLTHTDPLGHVTTNGYDVQGNLLSTTDPLGHTTVQTYDIQGNLTSSTDALGNKTTNEYDRWGNQTSQTDALGHVTAYTSDGNGNRATETKTRTKADGTLETLVTSYTYDAANRSTKTTYPDGSTNQTVYNAIGKQTQTVDALGRIVAMEYDDQGRLIKNTYQDGGFDSSTYDVEGHKIASTDRAGRSTQFVYDSLGRLTDTIYPDGVRATTAYDQAGQITTSTDALGHVTSYQYDAASRRTQVNDALGHQTLFTYDNAGSQTRITDASGHAVDFVYDEANRPTQVIYLDGTREITTYDTLGRTVKKTDQAGKDTKFQYDALGRSVKVTDALNQDTTYGYDELGNQINQTDANGHTTQFVYDNRSRRIARILPLGQTETYAYDAAGNLINKIDFNGKIANYSYDSLNRLVSKTPDPSFGEPAVTYTYTASGLRASMSDVTGVTTYAYDSRDWLLEKATPQGTLSYTYDAQGNLTGIRSNHVDGVDIVYEYDALNRLAKVIDQRLANGETTYSYDTIGNLAGYVYPNGVETSYTYNTLNRLTDLQVKHGSDDLAHYTYTLGPSGNRTQVQELGGRTVQYTYDGLYRLVRETIAGAPQNGQVDYVYDSVGNRLSRNSTLPTISNQTFAYDGNDRLTSDSYDNNGNTIASASKTYGYDIDNRLITQNGSEVVMAYDGNGNRVAKTVGGVTTEYLVDTLNPTGYVQVLEEIKNGQVVRRMSYGNDLISQAQKLGSSWQAHFFVYDDQGSVRLLPDDKGIVTDEYDYDGFGNILRQFGTTVNTYLYKGEYFDSNIGFYNLRARYLNADVGRFISWDSDEGSSTDPLTLHKYIYVGNNPINNSDPSGNQFEGIGGVMAAVAIEGILASIAMPNYAYAAYVPRGPTRMAVKWSIKPGSHWTVAEAKKDLEMAKEIMFEMFGILMDYSKEVYSESPVANTQSKVTHIKFVLSLFSGGSLFSRGSELSGLAYKGMDTALIAFEHRAMLTFIGSTIAHELGHTLNLDHHPNQNNLMYESMDRGQNVYSVSNLVIDSRTQKKPAVCYGLSAASGPRLEGGRC